MLLVAVAVAYTLGRAFDKTKGAAGSCVRRPGLRPRKDKIEPANEGINHWVTNTHALQPL